MRRSSFSSPSPPRSAMEELFRFQLRQDRAGMDTRRRRSGSNEKPRMDFFPRSSFHYILTFPQKIMAKMLPLPWNESQFSGSSLLFLSPYLRPTNVMTHKIFPPASHLFPKRRRKTHKSDKGHEVRSTSTSLYEARDRARPRFSISPSSLKPAPGYLSSFISAV